MHKYVVVSNSGRIQPININRSSIQSCMSDKHVYLYPVTCFDSRLVIIREFVKKLKILLEIYKIIREFCYLKLTYLYVILKTACILSQSLFKNTVHLVTITI